jgi:predicted glutamine amidotransferase
MARLFGLIGNRADLGGRVLAFESQSLRVHARAQRTSRTSLGWGLGFYQGGEVLMRRRPLDDRPDIDVADVAGDVRADIVLGHVRAATVGALRTENTHPFRYRQWLFAQTGTVARFDAVRDRLVSSVPEFLRSGIRGETDAEVLFHVFLSFLHDAGRLNDGVVGAEIVREALRSSLAVVDGMTAEVGGEPGALNLLVSNGDYMVAVHRAQTMAYRILKGKEDADAIIGEDTLLRRKTAELARMHFVLIASDFDVEPGAEGSPADTAASTTSAGAPPRWRTIGERAIVTLTRGDEPLIEAL